MSNFELWFLILILAKALVIILPIFISVAFMTLFERKVMATMQRRRGPNIVGFIGLLQPFADALKLITKEMVVPYASNGLIFVLCPIFSLIFALMGWAFIPFQSGLVYADFNFSVLYVFAISSLNVYTLIMSGWSSNSKYSFLGSLRAVAQMISYEVSIGVLVMCVVVCAGSFNFSEIIFAQSEKWYVLPLLPIFLMFFVSALAETNRPPFDLPEAENELVAGYFVEYSGAGFALFFIAETSNIIFMSTLIVIYFLGGWFFCGMASIWFLAVKILLICFVFVWVRASLPRYRYDQLMFLGWKVFLPISISFLCFVLSFFLYFNGFFISL